MVNPSEKVPGAENQQEDPSRYESGLATIATNLILRLQRLRDAEVLRTSVEKSNNLADLLARINEELKAFENELN